MKSWRSETICVRAASYTAMKTDSHHTSLTLTPISSHHTMKSKILLLGVLNSVFLNMVNAQSPPDPAQAAHQNVAAKLERVTQGTEVGTD